MKFPLKLALSAVLAKTIAGELTHMAQTQQLPKELDIKYQVQPNFQQAEESNDSPMYADAGKSAYNTYQSPDPIQQYASSFNAGNTNEAINAEPSNEAPTYLEPYPYSRIVPYANGNVGGYNAPGYNPGAFSVQTGYEGYLVPAPPAAATSVVAARSPVPSFLAPFTSSFTALTNSFPESMRTTTSLLGRSFSFLLGLLGATIFGGGLTTFICSFTPLCTITFALPLVGIRSGLKDLAEPFVGAENAEMFQKAMEKFSPMSTIEKVKMAAKSDGLQPETEIKEAVKAVEAEPKIEDVDKKESGPNTK